MKKLVATILIALLAMSCLLAFVGCNNNDNDSNEDGDVEIFIGAVSKSTYSSREDAVRGFLAEELSGQMIMAEYVGYTKIADLSQSEIDKLTIEEEFKDGIISVERGEVEYIEKEITAENELLAKLAVEAVETYKREVYVVTYDQNSENIYRFLTPAEEVGESPTASSLASIFDVEKYLNCTLQFVAVSGLENVAGYKVLSKIAENGICDIWSNESEDFTDESCVITYNNAFYYVEHKIGDEEWGKVYAYLNDDYNFSDYTKDHIKECFIGCWANLLYSYSNCFEKTDTGYAITRQIIIANLDNTEDSGYSIEDCNVIISNERIVSVTLCINADGIKDKYSTTFSDFGTTTVDVPKEAMDAVKEYADNLPTTTEPAPIEGIGKTPSESDWNSLFNAENYLNSTIICRVDNYVNNMNTSMVYRYSLAGNGINIVVDAYLGEDLYSEAIEFVYMVEYNGNLYSVVPHKSEDSTEYGNLEISNLGASNGWLTIKDCVVATINDFFKDFMVSFLEKDKTIYDIRNLFIKTASGYKMNSLEEYNLDYYNIETSNEMLANIEYKYRSSVEYSADIGVKLTFSDFGTTEFDVPKDIMDAIKAYIVEN
ncbi:MAG: hypothetical protein K2K85_07465 [Clostridia bacterium]|nr:hypothetical protein [Clostridia bacterium]